MSQDRSEYFKERYRRLVREGRIVLKGKRIDEKVNIMVLLDDRIYDLEKEMQLFEKAEKQGKELNFLLFKLPRKDLRGKKCFIHYAGYVIGYHYITAVTKRTSHICEETGRRWPTGWYAVREGKFHKLESPIKTNVKIHRNRDYAALVYRFCEELV